MLADVHETLSTVGSYRFFVCRWHQAHQALGGVPALVKIPYLHCRPGMCFFWGKGRNTSHRRLVIDLAVLFLIFALMSRILYI